ncbi:MAG: Xaa-Pro peptidase family protein [Saccharofermentans sp.]|nr:Xaa-Pro peptidase family protein [Saccharofermentans sp.]
MSIESSFFKENRDSFSDRLPEGAAVFIFAGVSRQMTQDSDYRFLPDRNFYYLTGIEVPSCKLIILKKEDKVRTMLFVPPKDDMTERWHGKRKTHAEYHEISAIAEEDIFTDGDFDDKKYEVFKGGYKVAYDGTSVSDENRRFMKAEEAVLDVGEILTRMRMVKKPCEVEAIRQAARITEDALADMKKSIREGVCEFELFTELEYHMARRGTLIPAFETIVAINDNAFYLHHSDPEGKDGPLVTNGGQIQIDVGARVDGYCADISRVYFTGAEQGDSDRRYKLYELIKNLRREALAFIKPGVTFASLNEHIREIVAAWLKENNLLEEAATGDDAKRYYWHNTGHHLGLDVHDISLRELPFEAGNCLAIEPGVYIPEWHVGFRIEDDVIVTEDGCEYISSGNDDIDNLSVEF